VNKIVLFSAACKAPGDQTAIASVAQTTAMNLMSYSLNLLPVTNSTADVSVANDCCRQHGHQLRNGFIETQPGPIHRLKISG